MGDDGLRRAVSVWTCGVVPCESVCKCADRDVPTDVEGQCNGADMVQT